VPKGEKTTAVKESGAERHPGPTAQQHTGAAGTSPAARPGAGQEDERFCPVKGGLIVIKKSELKEFYSMMYPDYPDIVTVPQMQKMLGISRGLAYKLIREDEIHGVKIGNALRVPKVNIVNYVLSDDRREAVT
jgi:hypothetical protein